MATSRYFSKTKKCECNFHNAAMPMVMSKVLKSLNFIKTRKSRYLQNETLFFLQMKKLINYTSRASLWQKIVF